MPKFKELISIKFKGKTLQAIGYRLAARNKLDCMIYSNLQTSHTKDLSDDSKIKLEQYQELKKCNEQWLKDNKHAAIVLRIYDPETNTYYESTNFITRRSKSIWDATTREYKTPIQITKDFYVIIQGSITQVNPNDSYAKDLGLNLDLESLIFDEEMNCHVSSDGRQWTNLTKENVDLSVITILNTYRENANIIDHTDNLYIDNAIFKNQIFEKNEEEKYFDFSNKNPEQIDEKLNEQYDKFKISDYLIEKIKASKSYLLKKEEDIAKKIVPEKPSSGIIDEE